MDGKNFRLISGLEKLSPDSRQYSAEKAYSLVLVNLGAKLKFSAPIASSVGNLFWGKLQLPLPSSTFNKSQRC